MSKQDLTRRAALAASGAAVLAGAAAPAKKEIELQEPPLFTSGLLANNQLAAFFKRPPAGLKWPNVQLMTPDRKLARIDAFRGKTLVVSLWAEWCTPCLKEMPGMAVLARMSASDKFQILCVLSGTEMNEPADAADVLRRAGAPNMPTYMDGSFDKNMLLNTLGSTRGALRGVIPCNVLIDGQGRVRGRSIGGESYTDETGKSFSIWGSNIALQFCQGLAQGALDQLPV